MLPNRLGSPGKQIEVLLRHGVEFLVVGGLSAVIRGAPIMTLDLDILHRRTTENVQRLLTALASMNASYRYDHRGLKPQEHHLMTAGHSLLKTDFGSLDVLGSVGKGLIYEDMLPESDELPFEGMAVRVLRLSTYIRLKEELGREKDLAVLPVLRDLLRESGEN